MRRLRAADCCAPAGQAPSIPGVNETRSRRYRGASAPDREARPFVDPLDDWLGEVSDEDWNEGAAEAAERRRSAPASQDVAFGEEDFGPEPPYDRPPAGTATDRRAQVERRRIVAGLVALVLVGIAAAAAVVAFRGGSDTTTPPTTAVTTPTTTPTETPSGTTTTPSTTTPSTTTPSKTTPSTTTPSTEASSFTLPEGTKLRRGEENDPAVVTQLQEALTAAGYDPGPADGTYGRATEAAVVAFQEANGLSADGVVGAETAAALNEALQGA
jgi:murein L,D-transpeptidase YcbB/YkuD